MTDNYKNIINIRSLWCLVVLLRPPFNKKNCRCVSDFLVSIKHDELYRKIVTSARRDLIVEVLTTIVDGIETRKEELQRSLARWNDCPPEWQQRYEAKLLREREAVARLEAEVMRLNHVIDDLKAQRIIQPEGNAKIFAIPDFQLQNLTNLTPVQPNYDREVREQLMLPGQNDMYLQEIPWESFLVNAQRKLRCKICGSQEMPKIRFFYHILWHYRVFYKYLEPECEVILKSIVHMEDHWNTEHKLCKNYDPSKTKEKH